MLNTKSYLREQATNPEHNLLETIRGVLSILLLLTLYSFSVFVIL